MKHLFLIMIFSCVTGNCFAKSQCDVLREKELTLLPNTTFELRYSDPLRGCFSGYLYPGPSPENSLYHFGVFQNGRQVVLLPVVMASRELTVGPYQGLEILAVSFGDMDHDGQRDVTIIARRLSKNEYLVFAQVYWGCGDSFDFNDDENIRLDRAIGNRSHIDVKFVEQFISRKKLKSGCTHPKR